MADAEAGKSLPPEREALVSETKKSDLPVRLGSAVIMLAVAIAALAIGGQTFDTFVVLVALAAFVEFALLVIRATANVAFRLAAIIAGALYFGIAGGVLTGAADFLIVLIIGVTVFTDKFAYYTGRAFGGP
jgi:phosphatidate cytidylyltransferase